MKTEEHVLDTDSLILRVKVFVSFFFSFTVSSFLKTGIPGLMEMKSRN